MSVGEGDQPRTSSRRWVGVAGLAVVVLLVGAALVATWRSDGRDRSGPPAIGAAAAPVGFDEPHRFEMVVRSADPKRDPADDELVRVLPTELRTTATVVDATHWEVVSSTGAPVDPDPLTSERRRVGTRAWERQPFFEEDLPVRVPRWRESTTRPTPIEDLAFEFELLEDDPLFLDEAEPGETPSVDGSFAAHVVPRLYLLPAEDDPAHVARVVLALTDQTVVEQLPEGRRRLRGLLPPIPEMVEAAGLEPPPIEVALVVDEEGRPLSVDFAVALLGQVADVSIRFSHWGGVLGVTAPPEDEIDRTPWVREEVLGLQPELLVAPTQLPDGFGLLSADMIGAGDECASFMSFYAKEDAFAAPRRTAQEAAPPALITLTAARQDCAEELEAGPNGLGDRPGSRYVELDDLLVQVDAFEVDDEAVDELLSSIRAVDLEELLGSFADWVRDAVDERGLFVEL